MNRTTSSGTDQNTDQNRMVIHKDGRPCYSIVYSTDFKDLKEELSRGPFAGRRALIVTDSNAGPLYAQALADAITPHPQILTLPAGEDHKNLDTIAEIYQYLIENHYDRKSYLIALGGGVIGDMTGYAAATFLRGIDYIQVPTTLLAQADSSIGGKTGVDFRGYKNMVGAFKMPSLVFADVDFLKTLDQRQFASGFAEVMKHGIIRDKAYYNWLLEHADEINARDSSILHRMLYRSNEIKRDVVERDPYEKRERMLLNFGHTIGHAIEKYSHFTLLHGECVALGCVAAAWISFRRGYIDAGRYHKIRDMFVPFGLPVTLDSADPEAILTLTRSDKKMADGHIRFILLHDIGDAFIDETVTDEEILDAVRQLIVTD